MIAFLKTCKDKCKIALTPANFVVFLQKSNHWWLAVILLLLTPVENYFLRLIDPTAAPLDSGVYSVVYTAFIALAAILGFATMGQRINNKPSFDGVDDDTKVIQLLSNVSPTTQLWYSFAVFCLYVIAGCLCFVGVAMIAG